MANGLVGPNHLDEYNVSFDSFHTGETPKTASDATKFFPMDANEVLNTPTGIDSCGTTKNSGSSGRFFADDFQKPLPHLSVSTVSKPEENVDVSFAISGEIL